MGMSINIVACVGVQSTGKQNKLDEYGSRPDERFEKFRTILKSPDDVDVCPELKEKFIYKFEDFTWFRLSHRERGYNSWREKLANLVAFNCRNDDSNAPGPFRELFWISSCAVTYGPAVVIKLSLDFANWRGRAESFGDDDFMETYNLFVDILDYASVNGAFWFELS